MSILSEETPRCSVSSLAANEQLFASAPRTNYWILVEYSKGMGAKALKESSLPEAVVSHLTQIQKTIQYSRLLLIRKAHNSRRMELSAFVGITTGDLPRLYRMKFQDYNELLSLDLPGMESGTSFGSFTPYQDQLLLVCTNGKRDPCCAQWGTVVFKRASQYTGELVWQTSHMGGHRFAANMICLPHGIYYGRVRPDSVTNIIDDCREQRINLDHYRGRARYSSVAQAAEYFLMRETASTRLESYRLDEVRAGLEGEHQAIFISNVDGTRYSVNLRIETLETEMFESCSKPDKLVKPSQYVLQEWRQL